MEARAHRFRDNAKEALADKTLQAALGNVRKRFIEKRRKAIDALPEFEQLRDDGRAIRDHTLAHLDQYLTQFEAQVLTAGGHVHWCRNAEEARARVLAICQAEGVKRVTKGKTMIGEEIAINAHLARHGIEAVETDLGEYIIQLRGETPSHLIAPAVHVPKAEVEKTFRAAHGDLDPLRDLSAPESLLQEARAKLRQRFLEADAGITGANFLIAETGSVVIVTNEGNGDLTQTLPPVHIVLASIEKVVPRLEDAGALLRLLARSATGQDMSVYTTFATGARRADDLDGPRAFHVILLDNGRSALLGGPFESLLRCIRCGACLNHCPVYHAVGGHAYGWVYAGPIGAALNPALLGLPAAAPLPDASSLCGRCEDVCPVRIPLPSLLRRWRVMAFAQMLGPPRARHVLVLWAWLARRPRLYRHAARMTARIMRLLAGKRGYLRHAAWLANLTKGWMEGRDMPAPEGRTFHDLYRAQTRKRPS